MNKRLIALMTVPVLAAPWLAGCGDDRHYHRERERTVVREEVVTRPEVRDEIIIEGDGPEPPPRVEKVVIRPRADAVWHRGHWVHERHRWIWVNGYWS